MIKHLFILVNLAILLWCFEVTYVILLTIFVACHHLLNEPPALGLAHHRQRQRKGRLRPWLPQSHRPLRRSCAVSARVSRIQQMAGSPDSGFYFCSDHTICFGFSNVLTEGNRPFVSPNLPMYNRISFKVAVRCYQIKPIKICICGEIHCV